MLADPLTKIRADLASPALEQTLSTGFYRFVSEQDELADRAQDKKVKYRSRSAASKRLPTMPMSQPEDMKNAEEAESSGS
eukprot:582488-Amphidinium_carterae.1